MMVFRRLGTAARSRRVLAVVAVVTSLVVLFLGDKLPKRDAVQASLRSLHRHRLHINDTLQDSKLEVPPMYKHQENQLMAKIKEIATSSLENYMLRQKNLDDSDTTESIKAQYDTFKETTKKDNGNKTKGSSSAVNPALKMDPVKETQKPAKVVMLVPSTDNKTNNSTIPPDQHPDRFKFIHEKKRVSLDGPRINTLPGNITWRHDLDHIDICNDTDPFILGIVISAVPKMKLRDYIRRTWANPRLYPYTKVRSVFIVGATNDKALQDAVDKENAQYSDIIQYEFIDSYANLTHKSLAWLSWVSKNCPTAQFIAKIDDDVMVNPFHLRAYFENVLKEPPVSRGQPSEPVGSPQDNIATTYIYGRYDGQPYPMRYSKWGVTKDEYPEGVYPPFVHGPAYVLGRAAAKQLLQYAPYVPFLKLEDVYTTGLLAHAAQVKHVEIFGVVNTFQASGKLYNGTQALMEETNEKSREMAWEGICLYAPVNIKQLGTPWT